MAGAAESSMQKRPNDDDARDLVALARLFAAAGYGAWLLADLSDAGDILERRAGGDVTAAELERATSESGYFSGTQGRC